MKWVLIPLVAVLVFWGSARGRAFELKISKVVRFGAGLVTGIIIHEGGHLALTKIRGRDLKWHWEPDPYGGAGGKCDQL